MARRQRALQPDQRHELAGLGLDIASLEGEIDQFAAWAPKPHVGEGASLGLDRDAALRPDIERIAPLPQIAEFAALGQSRDKSRSPAVDLDEEFRRQQRLAARAFGVGDADFICALVEQRVYASVAQPRRAGGIGRALDHVDEFDAGARRAFDANAVASRRRRRQYRGTVAVGWKLGRRKPRRGGVGFLRDSGFRPRGASAHRERSNQRERAKTDNKGLHAVSKRSLSEIAGSLIPLGRDWRAFISAARRSWACAGASHAKADEVPRKEHDFSIWVWGDFASLRCPSEHYARRDNRALTHWRQHG